MTATPECPVQFPRPNGAFGIREIASIAATLDNAITVAGHGPATGQNITLLTELAI